LMSPIQG
jgi:hypothetical protein